MMTVPLIKLVNKRNVSTHVLQRFVGQEPFAKLNITNQDVFAHLVFKEIRWSAAPKLDAVVTTIVLTMKSAITRVNHVNHFVSAPHVPEVLFVKPKTTVKDVTVHHRFKEMDMPSALHQVSI